jgi:hypothetical protein
VYDGWSDLSAEAQRAKVEAIPIISVNGSVEIAEVLFYQISGVFEW